MSYFGTPQTSLAGRADLFQANPDFQSLLDASLFDLGTASNSDLTQTTAAPATGPSGALGASDLQPAPITLNGVAFGQGYDISDKDRLNIDLARAMQPDDSKYDQKLEKLRSAMREEAVFADKMGRKNLILGSLLKDIPKAITNMAMAGTVYNAQNAVAPYNAAQYGRQYFT
tara:strand:+ start:9906 stop:10421 length:516 start_codon:yes stop_codon:yes gene_type:complete